MCLLPAIKTPPLIARFSMIGKYLAISVVWLFCIYHTSAAVYASTSSFLSSGRIAPFEWAGPRTDMDRIRLFNAEGWERGKRALDYAKHVNEAVRLIIDNDISHDRVFLHDFSNVLPFLLSSIPPKGQNAWYSWNRTYSEEVHRNADDVYRDVEAIVTLAPRPDSDLTHIDLLYKTYIAQNFEEISRSENLILFRKKK
jgi:hypothetical protein